MLDEQLVHQYVEEAAAYVSAVASELGAKIERIGIDAPRTPRKDQSPRRQSERAMDGKGISCFTTPSKKEFERIFDKVQKHMAQEVRRIAFPMQTSCGCM